MIRLEKFKVPLIIVVFFLTIENLVLAFNNLQDKTPILGLRVDNKRLSFLPGSLKFLYKNQIFEVKQDEVVSRKDYDQFRNELISAGRKGNFLQKIIFQNAALLGLRNIDVKDNLSQTLLTLKILQIQDKVNKDALPIRPDFKGDINKTLLAADGVGVDTNRLTILISDNVFNPPPFPIGLPTTTTFTTHNESELVPIRKQAVKLIQQPISISSAGQIFTLGVEDLKSLMTLAEKPDPHDPKRLVLVLRLDEHKLNEKLGVFAEQVQKITQAEFNDHAARAAIYSQFFTGKRFLVQIPTGNNPGDKKVLGIEAGNSQKVVYLTFDDGPNNIYHPLILDILKTYDVRATFFLVGANTQHDLDIAKRTIREGHKIGNHSLTHPFLPNLTSQGITNELTQTSSILKSVNNNQNISLFRPPYGGVNLYVKSISNQLGLKLVLWDVDPRDWTEPGADELIRRVVSNVQNGSDILLHSNHLSTVKALPEIIEALKNKGYSFGTI